LLGNSARLFCSDSVWIPRGCPPGDDNCPRQRKPGHAHESRHWGTVLRHNRNGCLAHSCRWHPHRAEASYNEDRSRLARAHQRRELRARKYGNRRARWTDEYSNSRPCGWSGMVSHSERPHRASIRTDRVPGSGESTASGRDRSPDVEDHGTQTMEGLLVEGKRGTITIPAGVHGNDRPMQVATERWFLSELQLVMLTKTSNPKSGEQTSRVTNLERNEPDPALFQVPADHAIEQH
jgi:hypothetical protein